MKISLEGTATSVLVAASLVVAAAAVRIAFLPPAASGAASQNQVSYVDEWDDLIEAGRVIGNPDAKVTIVEFGDLQCRFCARFHNAFKAAQAEFGDDLALVFVHYPLSNHPQARPAALGAECANVQGRFEQYVDIAFDRQYALSTLSPADLAQLAGVDDADAFDRCMAAEEGNQAIDRGRRLGATVGVSGTPTVIVNGWRLRPAPYDTLSAVISRALDGAKPFDKPGG